ncbi:MAG: glycosyltransferase family 8 protein [Elainellaceae cyanobacterium]
MNNQLEQDILVACAADENYAMPLAVTVRSLVANLDPARRVVLFVLDGGIKPSQKQRIERSLDPQKIEIKWIQPSDDLLKDLPVSEKYPVSTYYRLLLPQIIPDHIQKIIYLDSDLIIQSDLGQLWDIELGNRSALAVQDICHRYVTRTNHINPKKYGIKDDCKYFNTGVLVINLERWRTDNTAEKAIDIIRNNPEEMLFADQDALNIVLAGQWGELDPRWNQMHAVHDYQSWQESLYSEEVFQDVVQHPHIIHFTTPPKPWSKGCNHPEQKLFFQYLDMTAWQGWRNTLWRRAFRKIRRLLPVS